MAMQEPTWGASDPVVAPAQPQARPAAPRQASRRQSAPRPQVNFADDLDAMTRTIIGESYGQGEVGMQAVGEVIRNRAQSRGQTIRDVVTAPYQFEPWGTAESARRLMSITPDDPRYQEARRVAEAVYGGRTNVTNGADHFYAPKLQADLGRDRPNFDNGTGRQIGDHLFFNLEGGDAAPAQAAPAGQEWGQDDPVVAPASSAMDIRTPDLGNVLKGDAWAPWLTRPGRRVEQGGVTQGADGVTEVNLDTPGILDNGNGQFEIYDAATESYYPATAAEAAMLERRLAGDLQKRREAEARRDDPAYQAEYEEMRGRAENVPAWMANLGVGGTLNGIQEIIALNGQVLGGDVGAQAARDSWKDRQDTLLAEDPLGTVGMQLAGGLLTPGLKGTGDWIAGASGAARTGRAAVVGGGYGATAGVLGGEGDAGERIQQGLLGATTGAVTGGLLDSALVRATQSSTQPAASSAARRLSRRGVNLTPGQMASEVPVVGDVLKYTEDLIGGFNPMMGGVRRGQNEDVIRAAGQEALDRIGVTLPSDARTGYQVAQKVIGDLGDAYDAVLPRVQAKADTAVLNEFSSLIARAGQTLDDSRLRRLNQILDDGVMRRFTAGGDLSGEEFKRIETTLRQQSERANRPSSTLEDQDLADFLDESRDIVRNLIARQNPTEAARIQDINAGYAVAARIRRAVSGGAQMSRQGTPTPGEMTQTVAQMSSDSSLMNQRGLLQGLASDARTVLPSGMADTGSGQRAVIGGAIGVLGTGGIATVNPVLAASIVGGMVAYSPVGIKLVNAVYRATDGQARSTALAELYRFASRNPALKPYYQAAVEAAQSDAGNQSPEPAPTATGLLAPTAP